MIHSTFIFIVGLVGFFIGDAITYDTLCIIIAIGLAALGICTEISNLKDNHKPTKKE